jgi:hypothetical protein
MLAKVCSFHLHLPSRFALLNENNNNISAFRWLASRYKQTEQKKVLVLLVHYCCIALLDPSAFVQTFESFHLTSMPFSWFYKIFTFSVDINISVS